MDTRSLMGSVFCLAMGSMLVSARAHAQSFPTGDAYNPIYCSGSASVDPAGDEPGADNERDVVGTLSEPAVLYAEDSTHVYLRMRVDADPSDGAGFSVNSWGFALDMDGDLSKYDLMLVVRGDSDEVWLQNNSTSDVSGSLYDDPDNTAPLQVYAAADQAQIQSAGSDFFVSVALSFEDLFDAGYAAGPLRVYAGTLVGASSGGLNADVACHDGGVLGDPNTADMSVDSVILFDSDADGVLNAIERPQGVEQDSDGDYVDDYLDEDDDGDSVLTKNEAQTDQDNDGISDYLDPDDDGDGISTYDENTTLFGADVDNDGIRNYLDMDSDGDGVLDRDEGVLDTNENGIPDYLDWMTFPNPDAPDSQVDSDGDGVADMLECPNLASCPDTDGDGSLDYLDLDSDNDGIADQEEPGDENENGVPDRLELGGSYVGGSANCSLSAQTGSVYGWLIALLALAIVVVVRRRKRFFLCAALSTCALGLASHVAFADPSVPLNAYRPAPLADDGFALSRPDQHGHGRLGFQLQLDYAKAPLVYQAIAGDEDSETAQLVSDQLVVHGVLSLALWDRAHLFLGLPVNAIMQGDSFIAPESADGAGVGDGYVGGRVRIAGDPSSVFALGLQLSLTLPSAKWSAASQQFSGEQSVSLAPSLLSQLRFGQVHFRGNVGWRWREKQEPAFLEVGQELNFGLGAGVDFLDRHLEVLAEGFGATQVDAFAKQQTSPLGVLLGGKFFTEEGWTFGVAAGPGFLGGYGSPDYRVVAMLGLGSPLQKEREEPASARGPQDTDADGHFDVRDRCLLQPEDIDGFEDEDGCPDPDNDQDGVLDPNDQCPSEREDQDNFNDQDGCVDPDNDKDSVLDAQDGCVNEPEDRDQFADEDGCPDPDNDQDTLRDEEDSCPLAPGKPEDKGCPKAVRLDSEAGEIVVLERVEFATKKESVLEKSFPILHEVAQILKANPHFKRVRVEGHTDDRGNDKKNMALSKKRAASVMSWLVNAGVPTSTLEAYGCGETRPMASNRDSEGRQTNRRVEFHVMDPAPQQGSLDAAACEPAN